MDYNSIVPGSIVSFFLIVQRSFECLVKPYSSCIFPVKLFSLMRHNLNDLLEVTSMLNFDIALSENIDCYITVNLINWLWHIIMNSSLSETQKIYFCHPDGCQDLCLINCFFFLPTYVNPLVNCRQLINSMAKSEKYH